MAPPAHRFRNGLLTNRPQAGAGTRPPRAPADDRPAQAAGLRVLPPDGTSAQWLPHHLARPVSGGRVRRDEAEHADAMAALAANGAWRLARRRTYGAPRHFFDRQEGKAPLWGGDAEEDV